MAIDSTLYGCGLPAGSYAVGDTIPLVNIDGPANVRSGRGQAILKRIFSAMMINSGPLFRIHIKNSDWVDEVQNVIAPIAQTSTAFDRESGCSQNGHNAVLTANSGWQIYAECIIAGTSTVGNSIFCLIDIDYPAAGGITDPSSVVGIPASISLDMQYNSQKYEDITTSMWTVRNVDYFKAGSEYALDAVELIGPPPASISFIAMANAAGMNGLQRIIPMLTPPEGIRFPIEYSSKLVKGPMDVKMKTFDAAAAPVTAFMVHDYVKRSQ